MLCFQDRSFCASPNCVNKCERRLTDELAKQAMLVDLPVCYGYFCDENGEPHESR